MRRLKEVMFLTVTAFCVPLMVSGVEPGTVANLRYHFTPEVTNAFSLQIENQGESGRETIEGTYLVSARSIAGNLVALTFKGQLRQKPMSGPPPMMMMPYRGPGYPGSLSSYSMRPQMEGMELIVDDVGNTVRASGDVPLPVPLGQIMMSLIEQLPLTSTYSWNSEGEVSITDEPLLQGPASIFVNSAYGGFGYGYNPGRPGLEILSAIQKISVRVTEVTNELVTLHKTMTLESHMRTGSDPRVSATAEEETVFDSKAGLPKSIELQCKTVVVTENVSRRSATTLRWKLLEGSEREAALNPPPPSPNPETELPAEDAPKLMEKLKSDDVYARQDAARRLTSARIAAPSQALLSRMTELVNDNDESVRNSALMFIANHGTQDHVMLLIKSLNTTTDQNLRSAIVRGLGRLKDKRAADPLAEVLATGPADQLQYSNSRNSDAADALMRIGPGAEPAVIGLLKERNYATRWQACVILKRIGTAKSLSMLKALALAPSKELSEAAADACRAIESRESK